MFLYQRPLYSPLFAPRAHYMFRRPLCMFLYQRPLYYFILWVTIPTTNFGGLLTTMLSGLGSFTYCLIYCLLVAMLYSLSVVYALPIVSTLSIMHPYMPIHIHNDHDVHVLSYYYMVSLYDRVYT